MNEQQTADAGTATAAVAKTLCPPEPPSLRREQPPPQFPKFHKIRFIQEPEVVQMNPFRRKPWRSIPAKIARKRAKEKQVREQKEEPSFRGRSSEGKGCLNKAACGYASRGVKLS